MTVGAAEATLDVAHESFPVDGTFNISRGARRTAEVVVATVRQGAHVGRGECVPYARYGETIDGVMETLRGMGGAVADGLDRAALQSALPPGAARNALDCALWDLDAKRAGKRVWELARRDPPAPVPTAFTVSLGPPEEMRRKAAKNAFRGLLKIKLGGEGDLARIRAVREGAPYAPIVVDANEGWTPDTYAELAPELAALGVLMVEQPFPAGADDALATLERPLPVCADESAHDCASLEGLKGKYDMVNVKLDKTGGLTEALKLRDAAEAAGFGLMVGCMLSTSLSIAPALIVAQGAAVVDLDGPLLLARDREPGLLYDEAGAHPPSRELWG